MKTSRSCPPIRFVYVCVCVWVCVFAYVHVRVACEFVSASKSRRCSRTLLHTWCKYTLATILVLFQEELYEKYSTPAQQLSDKFRRGKAELDRRGEQYNNDKVGAWECMCVNTNMSQHICNYGCMHPERNMYIQLCMSTCKCAHMPMFICANVQTSQQAYA